jgi:hypothetical protein
MRLVHFRLAARGDVDERAFFNEAFGCGETYSAAATSDEGNFPWSFGIEILLTRWERPLGPLG